MTFLAKISKGVSMCVLDEITNGGVQNIMALICFHSRPSVWRVLRVAGLFGRRSVMRSLQTLTGEMESKWRNLETQFGALAWS